LTLDKLAVEKQIDMDDNSRFKLEEFKAQEKWVEEEKMFAELEEIEEWEKELK